MYYLIASGKSFCVIFSSQIIIDENKYILFRIGDKIRFFFPRDSLNEKEYEGEILDINGKYINVNT